MEKSASKNYRIVLAIVIPILLFVGLYCYEKGMFGCDSNSNDQVIEKTAGSDSGKSAGVADSQSDAGPAAVVQAEASVDGELEQNPDTGELEQVEEPGEAEEEMPSTDAPKPPTNQGRLRLMRE